MFGVHFYICHVGGVWYELPTVFGSKLHARNTDGAGGVIDNLRRGRRIHGAIFGYGQVESCRNGDRESGHQVAAIVTGAITVRIHVTPRFRSAVTAGAACRPAVLSIGDGRPTTVRERMTGVLIGAVSTVGTSRCAPVLGGAVIAPCAVGEVVTLIGKGADVASTGGAIAPHRMLRRTVLCVLGRCGVVSIAIRALPAVRAGIGAPVLGCTVIGPGTIHIGAVACAGIHECSTGIAILIPVTARPCGVGRCVIADRSIVTGIVISARRAIPITSKGVRLRIEPKSSRAAGASYIFIVLTCRRLIINISPSTA